MFYYISCNFFKFMQYRYKNKIFFLFKKKHISTKRDMVDISSESHRPCDILSALWNSWTRTIFPGDAMIIPNRKNPVPPLLTEISLTSNESRAWISNYSVRLLKDVINHLWFNFNGVASHILYQGNYVSMPWTYVGQALHGYLTRIFTYINSFIRKLNIASK